MSFMLTKVICLALIFQCAKAPQPVPRRVTIDEWRHISPRLNDAVQQVLQTRLKKVADELRRAKVLSEYLIGHLQATVNGSVTNMSVNDLNTLHSTITERCNQTIGDMWQLCYTEFKEICHAQARFQCPDLKESEIQSIMRYKFNSSHAPETFTPFQLQIKELKLFMHLNSSEESPMGTSTVLRKILLKLHDQSIHIDTLLSLLGRLDTSSEIFGTGIINIVERIQNSSLRHRRSTRPFIVPKLNIFGETPSQQLDSSTKKPLSKKQEINVSFKQLKESFKALDFLREGTEARRNFLNSLARHKLKKSEAKINFFSHFLQVWKTFKSKLASQYMKPQNISYRLWRGKRSVPRQEAAKQDSRVQVKTWKQVVSNSTHNTTKETFFASVSDGNNTRTFNNRTAWRNSREKTQVGDIQSGNILSSGNIPTRQHVINMTERVPITRFQFPRFHFNRPTTSRTYLHMSNPWRDINQTSQFHGVVTDESGTHEFHNEEEYNEYLTTSAFLKELHSVNKIISDLEEKLQHWKSVRNKLMARQRPQQQQQQILPVHYQSPYFPPHVVPSPESYQPPPLTFPRINIPSFPTLHTVGGQTYGQSNVLYPSSSSSWTRTSHGPWSYSSSRQWRQNSYPFGSTRTHYRRTKRQTNMFRPRDTSCSAKQVMESCTDLISRRGFCLHNLERACNQITVERRVFRRILYGTLQAIRGIVKEIENQVKTHMWFEDIEDLSIIVVSINSTSEIETFKVRLSIFGSPNFTIKVHGFSELHERIVTSAIKTYKELFL